jgi:glycerophosphoryl diester phosphodiesterase
MVLALLLQGCKKIKYYPDTEFGGGATRFLAHRGGGKVGSEENTLNTAKYAFSKLDGIEIDIQMSKDGTLWLSHDNIVKGCNMNDGSCFSITTDSLIRKTNECALTIYTYTTLDEVLKFMSENYVQSYISVDFKAWSPCTANELNILGTFKEVAKTLVTLTNKYGLEHQLMIESETAEFLDYVKDYNSNIKCFLTAFGDFERGMLKALENGYNGISFEYKFDEEINAQHVELLHRKGLQIQLWTVNDTSNIKEAITLKPDFIQTENIDYIIQLKSPNNE